MNIQRLAIQLTVLLPAAVPAAAQNLISDGSLELGVINSCSQGQVPDTWFNTNGTADTFTYDCAVLQGLAIDAFAHFVNLPAADDGIRFIAGWSSADETFGTSLTQPLVPGDWYDVRARFTMSETLSADGSYAIWLSMGPTMTGAVQVANIGTADAVGAWNSDAAHFQAPGAFTHMILQPVGNNYYVGSDSWSIQSVEGPESYCEGAVNSTGLGALMGMDGSVDVAVNQFELTGSNLPAGVWGQFFYGASQVQLPFGNGYRCIDGEVRIPPLSLADATGFVSQQVDLTAPPIASVAIPGAELYFQLWYRDPAAGGAFFNTTDGLIVRLQ